MKHAKGFSLVELMIVVAVVGILAVIAVPAYSDYVIRGKLVDATAGLSDGRVKLEQFFQDNRAYDAAGSPCPAATQHFTFACATATTTYTITATGIGDLNTFSYTIDQTNTKRTTALKAGWGAVPANCWIVSKGGTC